MRPRPLLVAVAVAAALVAIFLPTHWYDTIPRDAALPLPFRGVSLLRLTFAVEALVLVRLAAGDVRFEALPRETGYFVQPRAEVAFDLTPGWATVALALITLFGLLLRIHNLGQDLWLDEITPLVDYMRLSPAQVIGSYLRSNNHLLNTLLIRVSVGMFGESEWSARLPAVVFGTLAIPAIYWVGRIALSRLASLGAALLLAASYHHVFFSQNARGYTAYLLFALLSTGLLIQALRDDRAWRWALYIAAAVLGSASLLITGFVLAGHAILCGVIAVRSSRRGQPVTPFARRIGSVFAIAGFLAFQIYSSALPEVYVVINSIYAEPGTGYQPFSGEFFREMARGISAGFGNPLLALAFVVIGVVGYGALAFLCWPLAAGLTLPAVLTAVSLGIRGLTFSPRFFLLLLPLAMLAAVSGIQALVQYADRRRLISSAMSRAVMVVASVVLAAAAGRSLPYYFRTPKQPYRAALVMADRRDAGGRIVVVSNAATGFQYYVRRLHVADSARFVYTRSLPVFDSLTRDDGGAPPQVLTTFSRALRMEYPEIGARLERDWDADTTFAATVGDGEITVWSRKHTAPETR